MADTSQPTDLRRLREAADLIAMTLRMARSVGISATSARGSRGSGIGEYLQLPRVLKPPLAGIG